MIKKILTVVATSLLLSACTLPAQLTGLTEKIKSVAPTTTPTNNVFTSVKDAVTRQIALKCEYTDNGQTTTTYIKGKNVRLVGNNKSAGVEGLMKDDKFYLWSSKNNQDKKGMIIDIAKMEGAKMGQTPIKSIDDVVVELEKKKENCVNSTDGDSIFELPGDITFTAIPDLFGPTK
jgi:hypothetical protein